jgi:hypothetical protein
MCYFVCCHVRRPQEYGLSTNYVPQELIKQFFAYWWPTPLGSPERKHIKFAIKRGEFEAQTVLLLLLL